MKWMTDQVSRKQIEEMSMKWMDRQIAKKIKMPLKLIKFYNIFLYTYYNGLLHLIYFSGISMFFALFRLSVSEAHPLSVSVALGMSIHFIDTSSIPWLHGFYTRNINCIIVTEQRLIFTTLKYYIWSGENVCCFFSLPNHTGQHQWCQKPNNQTFSQ